MNLPLLHFEILLVLIVFLNSHNVQTMGEIMAQWCKHMVNSKMIDTVMQSCGHFFAVGFRLDLFLFHVKCDNFLPTKS